MCLDKTFALFYLCVTKSGKAHPVPPLAADVSFFYFAMEGIPGLELELQKSMAVEKIRWEDTIVNCVRQKS
jgi:hypothetical protein